MSKKNVEWEWKKLGDVCEVIAGQSPKGSSYNNNEEGMEFHQGKKSFGKTIIESSGVWTSEITKIASPEDILISVRAPVGPVNFTDRQLCIGRGLAAIRAKHIDKKYLYLFLVYNESNMTSKTGAVFDSISRNDIINFEIPIPPLDEQERIVKVLDDAFEKIDTIKTTSETNLQNAKDLFQTTLAQELTITEEKIKQGWEEKNIGEICRLISGDSKSNDLPEGNVPYVKVGDMNLAENDGSITTSSRFVKINLDDKKIFPIGTVIFPKRGGAILTNKKRLTSVPICCDLNIMGVIPSNQISSLFLFYFFENLDFSTLFNGAAIPQINNCDINPLKISLPPLPIQKQIVAKLDTLSEKVKQLESNYKQVLADCDELKKALLKQAFEGML